MNISIVCILMCNCDIFFFFSLFSGSGVTAAVTAWLKHDITSLCVGGHINMPRQLAYVHAQSFTWGNNII